MTQTRCIRMDHLTNDSIRSNLEICNINSKIIEHQNKWKDYVERMNENRLPRKLLNYKPRGYRNERDLYSDGFINGDG